MFRNYADKTILVDSYLDGSYVIPKNILLIHEISYVKWLDAFFRSWADS